MKKLMAVLICLLLVAQMVTVSFAHDEGSTVFHVKTCTDYKGRTCIGGENLGFMVNMNQYAGHATTFNLTYCFQLTQYGVSDLQGPYDEKVNLNTLNTDIKNMFRNAAEKWNAVTVNGKKLVNLREVSSGGDIVVKNPLSVNDNVLVIASTDGKPDEAYHTRKWTISLQMFKWLCGYVEEYGSLIFAHELGHVLGLADLSSQSNQNKLMYYTSAGKDLNNYQITTSEIMGLQLIMNHESHTISSPTEGICSECGLEAEHDFVSGSIVNCDGNKYYQKCVSCDYKTLETHTASLTSGKKLGSSDENLLTHHITRCTDCGKTIKAFHARGSNSAVNGVSKLYHYYSCTVCGQKNLKEGHSFNRLTNECVFCGYQRQEDSREINSTVPSVKE